jgi:alkaline phosphatase
MKKIALLAMLILAIGVTPAFAAPQGGPAKPAAKNVIVMISDGWGFNHLEAVSYYEYGKDARQIYNRFPFQFAISTWEVEKPADNCPPGYDPALAWSNFNYVKYPCATDRLRRDRHG